MQLALLDVELADLRELLSAKQSPHRFEQANVGFPGALVDARLRQLDLIDILIEGLGVSGLVVSAAVNFGEQSPLTLFSLRLCARSWDAVAVSLIIDGFVKVPAEPSGRFHVRL
jgi:hypothetical protein